ncbi:MAG: WD40/YVTN/BNR-like repeat-containing protein [Pseudoalteromonas sp.]|uniref:WD40/YVTN/BNR-like repeat-containing protein n=1 Tax=unclassified Pseudoalteromonas TaxID=194690 RepID=UPI003F99D6A2
MKYLLYACLAYSASCCAQDAPSTSSAIVAPNAEKTLLTDIEYTGQNLIAVGKHGVVISSSDAKSWQQASVPTQVLLTAIDFVDNKNGWACGHDATIINSQDGGQNWQLQQSLPGLDKPCLDILFTDNQNGFAVGAYGMFYKTSDGGESWEKRFLDSLLFPEDRDYLNDLKTDYPEEYEAETASILPHFNRIISTNERLMLVGEMGLLAQSDDQGQTWQRLDEIYVGSFFAFASSLNQLKGEEIVAGLRGNIFVRDGQQASWQKIENDIHATVNSIIKYNNKQWLLLANSGVIYHLKDNQLSVEQLADGKALLDGVLFEGKLVMASEDGIKVKELNP